MSAYWLGFFTLPALLLVLRLAMRLERYARNRGFTCEVKLDRGDDGPSDYILLSHDVWWERSFGPIFAGGWYREERRRKRATRWIGFGSTNGPSVTLLRTRDLGPAPLKVIARSVSRM